MGKIVNWCLIRGLFGAAVWFGFVGGIDGAKNIAIFISVFLFLISLGWFSDDAVQKIAKKGRLVPRFVSVSFDFYVAVVLIWYGSYVVGSLYILQMLFMEEGLSKVDKFNSEAGDL